MDYKEAIQDFFHPRDKIQPERVTEKFLQAQSNTFGPAALAYLMSFYGRETLEDEVVINVSMQEKGTRMYELIKAAEKFGFKAWGEKQNYAALKNMPMPLIAFINNDHYVTHTHNAVRLCSNYKSIWFPIKSGHHFDIISREISELISASKRMTV